MPAEAPYFSDRPFQTNEEIVQKKVENADTKSEVFSELAASTENAATAQAALTKPVGNPGDPRVKTIDAFKIQ